MAFYQIFQHAEEYINCLIAAMIVLSCYWYLISRRRRVLADFTCDGKIRRVYKLDNSIANSGFADVILKGSAGKPDRGNLRASVHNGIPGGWKLSIKGNNPQNLEDGKSYGIFGRLFVFHSYLGTHKPYRGHFIPIIFIIASSLIVQLYFSIYASINYGNIDPNYSFNLSLPLSPPPAFNLDALLNLARELSNMGTFLGLFAWETILLVIISIANSRRLTPEVIFFFFLTYLGYLLYPGKDALILTAVSWIAWCVVPPLLKRPLSWADKQLKKLLSGALGVIVTIFAVITVLGASLYVDRINMADPSQIFRVKVYAAAGGGNGLGLYNGLFRFESSQNEPGFVLGALFEELGTITGALCICLILLTALGCYFEGVRAEKYSLAVICFLVAGVIGLRAMFNIASATGAATADVMGLRLALPHIGTQTPFLTLARASGIMLGIGMILVESIKLSWRIKPAPAAIMENNVNDSEREPVPVSAAESESGE